MTMSAASARGSGEARGPIDALAASTTARRAAGEDRRPVEGRNAPGASREGFDATMSRALQQARRDAASHREENKGGARTQATGASASRPGAESAGSPAPQDNVARAAEGKGRAEDRSREGDGDETRTDGSSDTVAALLASADAAANGAAPIAAACAASADSVASLPVQADAAAGLAETSDAGALPAGKDAGSGAASLDADASAQQEDTTFAAAGAGRRKIGTDTDAGRASAASTDDATDASPIGGDAASDSAAAASSTASSTDSATHRASPDFAAQLAHARSASAHVTPFAEASRNATASPASAPASHAGVVSTPLHAAAFPAHFAAEVAVLGAAGIERAEIQLQPPELGPVRIELSLSGESTRIAFSAVQPETRQAIEQSLPILEDLLAERGLMLGNASVSDGGGHAGFGANGDAGSSAGAAPGRDGSGNAADGRTPAGDARRVALRRSLLDVYA